MVYLVKYYVFIISRKWPCLCVILNLSESCLFPDNCSSSWSLSALTNRVSAYITKTCNIQRSCKNDNFQLNCFDFLAHLSQRLIGELIGYPWSGIRPSVVRSQCSEIFFSKTAWLIKAKFYVEPPWVGGTIFCSRHLGHMTKMAATPIYGKNPSKIFFSRTGRPIFTKLSM